MIHVHHDGAAATLVMSRPPVNAIDPAFVAAFETALDQAMARRPTAVVIRSDQRAFCAGADLGLIGGYFDAPGGVERMDAYVRTLHRLFDRIEALPAITLACIRGAALGGGLELALACDLRIAAANATLGLPEARVGMIPGAGGTQRLTRLAGPGTAARLILSADVVDGREAQRLGIAQWVAEPADLDAETARVAQRIGELSRDALAASKDCMRAVFDPAVNGFERELEKPAALMRNADSKARIARFFAARNK
jgi:enoyl-CoA hydratase/carnithine racemase